MCACVQENRGFALVACFDVRVCDLLPRQRQPRTRCKQLEHGCIQDSADFNTAGRAFNLFAPKSTFIIPLQETAASECATKDPGTSIIKPPAAQTPSTVSPVVVVLTIRVEP